MHPTRMGRRGQLGLVTLVLGLLVLLAFARSIASIVIEYEWWRELGQLDTWISMALYRVAPVAGATIVAFVILWIAHARAMKFGGTGLRYWPRYARISSLLLLILSFLFANISVDTWTVVRFFGGRGLTADSYRDPVFGHPLSFYFFDLPFYELALGALLWLAGLTIVVYWVTARGWQLRSRLANMPEERRILSLEGQDLLLAGALESLFLRAALVIFLLTLAARYYLDRFAMLWNDHRFLVGIDYVDERFGLPLLTLVMAASVVAALLIAVRKWKWALWLAVVLVVHFAVPRIVSIFVRPSEISIQKPYIQRHIAATRSAYGLSGKLKEVEFAAKLEAPIDVTKHKLALDNVRLWDWQAFHDTITQIQALRPYYVFKDTDIDRYTVNGQMRQVLLTPREIDVHELPQAQARWINPRFVYTHGYGMVMAEANRISADGSPDLLIQNAPPEVKAQGLKLTRPELYYGEVSHEPVFVKTSQSEFDYPSGADNVHTTYRGKGGIPVDSLWTRLAAAFQYGDYNILITSYFTGESRMMIHRRVADRLEKLADFISWDTDPYLVLTDEGHMVWMVDGYTTSAAHPYARTIESNLFGRVNYLRNSVKATVDAYDGTVRLYVFDAADPLIQAYRHLFPALFLPASEMPADLRRHARYPEQIFLAQAEIYRTFHMRDPEAFYNNEDLWSFARNVKGQNSESDVLGSTYVLASLPDADQPEFLLMVPFTPRNKDNLIGVMIARCDGEHLGEIVVLHLSKQALIYGPLQVSALIDQDANISKDLSLWNQQGSQVLRGKMLVLPIENTFLYVQPIYIQAQSARLPQLKKVVLAMGKRLAYRDTYEQALRELLGSGSEAVPPPPPEDRTSINAPPASGTQPDRRVEEIRRHLQRYREFAAQGRWSEAGKELEAIEAIAR